MFIVPSLSVNVAINKNAPSSRNAHARILRTIIMRLRHARNGCRKKIAHPCFDHGWANGLGAMRACGGESGNHEGMPLRRICLAFRFAAETTQNKKDNKRRNEREQPNG